MKKLVFLVVFLLSITSFSQMIRLEGNFASTSINDAIGQLTIFSLPDSSLKKGSYIDSTYFSVLMDTDGSKEFYVKFKIPGFLDTLINFEAVDTVVSLGIIQLEADRNLETVEVKYIKPTYLRTMDGIKVNVEGTNLQTLPTLFDVLKASPKISSPDNERIEIIGKGSPLILIDRQPIITNDELKAIPADMIESIEIITNPSAKYRAQGKGGGVIEVYTKNFHLEGYNMTISANGGVNTQLKPSGRIGVGLSVKRKKFSFNGHFGGNYSSSFSLDSTYGKTTDDSKREYYDKSTSDQWWTWQYANLKAAYRINDKHKITSGYRMNGSLSGSNTNSTMRYIEDGQTTIQQEQSSLPGYTWLNNSAFLNYQWETDTNKSFFEVNFNYILKISEGNNEYTSLFDDVVSGQSSVFKRLNDSRDRPNIGELRINYEHVFDTTGWKLNVGGSFNMLKNNKAFDQYTDVNDSWVLDPVYSNSYDYKEHIGGIFTELQKDWDAFGFRLGIRGEYTGLNGYSNSLNKQFIDSVYILPFPSASILFEPAENLSMTIYYSSGIDRPSFSNFDPFVRIQDSLNIQYGNPFLRPAIEQSVGMEFDIFYAYNISVEYSIDRRPVSSLQFVDDSTFLINTTPWNADKEQGISVSLNAPIQAKWLNGWNSLWFEYNRFDYTPLFHRARFYNVTYGFYSWLNFMLPKNIDISNNLNIARWGGDGYRQNTVFLWGMRLTKKFKGNNFQIYLDVDDIIPPKYKSTTIAGNYQLNSLNQSQFTTFRFGFFYKFGRLKQGTNIKESESGQSGRI
ncbi:MAG: outer membrane beta-barrel protein [Crocinitomicaceae bacterium]